MKTTTTEGIGVVIYNEEGDYISFDHGQYSSSIGDIFEAAGAENVHSHLEHALHCIGGKYYDRVMLGSSPKQEVEAYRAETGRQYPKVYRIKVSVELDELADAETAAFWERRRYE